MAGGRDTKYKDDYVQLAFNYCLMGATDADLATFFDVSESTINNWKVEHSEFLESIKRGKHEADARIASSLYNRAKGYVHKETKIATHEGKITDMLEIEKHYAPDTTAAIFWLKNRQPKLWRDKQEVDHQSSDKSMSHPGYVIVDE